METPTQPPAASTPAPPAKKSGAGKTLLLIFVILLILGALFWFTQFGFFNPFSSDKDFDPPTATPAAKLKWTRFTREELIESFVTSVLVDRKGNELGACRWVKKIVAVSFSKTENPKYLTSLANYAKEFNAVSSYTKLVVVDSQNADVIVHLVNHTEFLQATNDDFLIKAGGFAAPRPNKNCEIQTGQIYLDLDQHPSELFLKIGIWHEMDHIIGFLHHNTLKTCSFNSTLCNRSDLSEVDKNFIDMLYNSGLPLCTKPAAARTYLLNNWQKKYNDN